MAHLRSSGPAVLGRKGDARREEQRGVAIVLSPGVVEDPFSSPTQPSSMKADPHRAAGAIAGAQPHET
jgi:hypothetical protein